MQVLHHPPEPEGLVVQGHQRLGSGHADAVYQRFCLGLEDGDWGAELVGDVGHHGLAELFVALERGRHRVERPGQFDQLDQGRFARPPGCP